MRKLHRIDYNSWPYVYVRAKCVWIDNPYRPDYVFDSVIGVSSRDLYILPT